jgi:hypothetical protein
VLSRGLKVLLGHHGKWKKPCPCCDLMDPCWVTYWGSMHGQQLGLSVTSVNRWPTDIDQLKNLNINFLSSSVILKLAMFMCSKLGFLILRFANYYFVDRTS